MSRVDMSPGAVSHRLRVVGEQSDLRADRRLSTKIDMSASAISPRLRAVGQALELCRRLSRRRQIG